MFISSDIMQHLGIILNYDAKSIQWGEIYAKMPMVTGGGSTHQFKSEMSPQIFNDKDDSRASKHTKINTKWESRILDACYEK